MIKTYSRWEFEPKDYKVIDHKEITKKQIDNAKEIISKIIKHDESD